MSERNIKNLKPSKKSPFKQGYINPNSCKKVFESQRNKPIIFRSSYERKFVWWCETCKDVKRWASEPFSIIYYNPLDKKTHKYWPDYLVEFQDGSVMVVEVKPYYQTQAPDALYGPGDRVYDDYVKNMQKWKAAREFCEARGMRFKVITERTISKL